MGCNTLLAEDLADGMDDPVAEMRNLVEPGQTGHQNARKAQQDQGRPAPYKPVDSVIDVGDRLQHKHPSPNETKNKRYLCIFVCKNTQIILNHKYMDVKCQ